MKLLILGGTGQLGRSLLEINWASDVEVLAPLRSELDLQDFKSTSKYIEQVKPDVVINATAWTDVQGAEIDSTGAHMLNCEAVSNLASTCKAIDSTLIHVSSDYVFDGEKKEPYFESDTTSPLNEYGKSKLAGEKALIECKLSKYYIIRTSWLYSKFGKNFVKTIIAKSLKNELASITDDQFGSPTLARDLATGIQSIIQIRPDSGIYHFSNAGITNWYEFGKLVYELTFDNPELVSSRKTGLDELKRPPFSPLDLGKWSSANLSPIMDWKVSLKRELPSIISAVREEVR